jgi:hypothetical protein
MQEATGAYKDIESVISNQADLVKVRRKLLPVAVIKGYGILNYLLTTYNLDPVAQMVEHRMFCGVISFLGQVKHPILLYTIANQIINRFKTGILLRFRSLIL